MKHNPKFGTNTVGWMQSTVKWMFEVLQYSATALKRWILSTLRIIQGHIAIFIKKGHA